jgi:hypothetical protein
MSPVIYLSSYFVITRIDRSCWFLCLSVNYWPIPVAARFKTWVCGRSVVGIAGSNSAWGMECCLMCVCVLCVGRWIFLRTADHTSREVLASAMSECDREASTRRWPSPTRAVELWRKRKLLMNTVTILISEAKTALVFSASSILTKNLLVLKKSY